MTVVNEITNAKGNKKVVIESQDGLFYCSVWVNRGVDCVMAGKEYKTLKKAEAFASKRMA